MRLSKKDVDIKKIVIEYEDGTTKDINKGAIIGLKPNGEEVTLSMEFCNFSGNDVSNMV